MVPLRLDRASLTRDPVQAIAALESIFQGKKSTHKEGKPKFFSKHKKWFNDYLYNLKINCVDKWRKFLNKERLNDNTKVSEIKPNLQNTSAFQEYWFAKRCYKANLDFSRKEYELEEFKTFIERHRSLKSLFKVFRRNNTSCTLPNPQVFHRILQENFQK